MRILMMPGHFYPSIGGSEKTALQYVKFFQEGGDDVVVLARHYKDIKDSGFHKAISIYRVKYSMIRLNPMFFILSFFGFVRSFIALLRVVNNFKPELIYVHLLQENAALVGLLSFFYNGRIISSPQGRDTPLYDNNKINTFLFKRLFDKSEKIVFNSKAFCSLFEKGVGYSFDENKKRIVPCAIDLTEFDDSLDKFNLVNNKKYILGCGTLTYYKRFDVLINGFNSLVNKYPDVDLVIVGDGKERMNLESLIHDLGISSRVHLEGWKQPEEVASYFRGCLFFVISSDFQEAFGHVTLEAMAAGKAVIGSNAGGTPEIIRDNYNGLLFEEGNHQMLAGKMAYLIDNSEKGKELGLNGRRLVEQEYSADIQKKIVQQIISKTS